MLFLFPAQVPETYSYTLSVALATGLPIVASALGALPERLAGRAARDAVPWDAPPAAWNDALLATAAGAAAAARRGRAAPRADRRDARGRLPRALPRADAAAAAASASPPLPDRAPR